MSLAIYVGLFSIWQALLPTWVNFVYDWAILHGTKWAKNKNYKAIRSHCAGAVIPGADNGPVDLVVFHELSFQFESC